MVNSTTRSRYRKALESRRRARARSVALVMSTAQASISAQPAGRRSSPPKLTAAYRYSSAPWFVALDGDKLVLGQSERGEQTAGDDQIHLDSLEATRLNSRKPEWKVPVGQSFASFGVSGGSFVCVGSGTGGSFSHVIRGFDLKDGGERWSNIEIEDADQLSVSLGSRIIATGWRPVEEGIPGTGVRLAAYQADNGARLWNYTPELRSVELAHCDEEGAGDAVVVGNWDAVISYQLCNVIGFTNAASGKPIREFSFEGHVRDVQVNADSKVAYVVTSSHTEPGKCTLHKLPLGKGDKSELSTFPCTDEHFLLLVDGGLVLLASYGDGELGPATNLQCFQLGKSGPIFEYDFEEQVIADIAKLPDSAGQYLLALSERLGESREPEGRSSIMRLRLADKAVWEVKAFDHPVLWLAPFKRECLALLQGGGVYSYNADSNNTKRLRKLLYEYMEPLYSSDRSKLAIISYPEGYRNNEPGQPMQVVVFN
jgi:hypothetical protein